MNVSVATLAPVGEMHGEDEAETTALRAMYAAAGQYVLAHTWCDGISEAYLGFGVGGVVAVFLVRIVPLAGADEWLWVVEGDLPSAYLVTDEASTPRAALERYAELMLDWVDAVRNGRALSTVFPVASPPDEEHAAMLESRMKLLRERIIPEA